MDDRAPPPMPRDGEGTLRAAELALGLVPRGGSGPDGGDPRLADEVARWEDDLARLADELPPIAPADRVLARLKTAMGAEGAEGPAPPAVPWWRGPLDSLALWRSLAGAGFAAAAAALALLMWSNGMGGGGVIAPSGDALRTLLVSPLQPRDGAALYVATYDERRATVILVPAAARAVPDRVPQLWLVPNDTDEPIALGSLDPERPHAIAVAPEHARLLDLNAGLVITLEPTATVTGAARGPVIAHGRFTRV